MAQPKWLKKYLVMKPEVNQIYEDLEQLKEFCVAYGHPYDEKNLYNNHSVVFQDFMRWKEGKHVRNQWYARPDGERKNFKPRDTNGPRGYNNYRSGHNR